MEAFIKALEATIAKQNILWPDKEDLSAYEADWRGVKRGKALCVVQPQNIEEVCKIVKSCNEHEVQIVPQGGNTGLVGAGIPDESGKQLVLNLQKFDKERCDIAKDHKSAWVTAGMTLIDLNTKLESQGLWFPVDIGAQTCCIGGMVATNAAGTRAGYYGNMAANVLALELVLADGRHITCQGSGNLADAGLIQDLHLEDYIDSWQSTEQDIALQDGNKLALRARSDMLQDNAIPALDHIFCGSSGAYTIVTAAKLKLTKLPESPVTIGFIPKDNKSSKQLWKDLTIWSIDHNVALTAKELMHRNALEITAKHQATFSAAGEVRPLFTNWPETQDYAYLLECVGADLEDVLNVFEPYIAEGLITDAVMEGDAPVWRSRHYIPEALRKEGQVIAADIAFPKNVDITLALDDIATNTTKEWPQLIPAFFGHYAMNAAHTNFVNPTSNNTTLDEETIARIRHQIYEITVEKYQGTFSAEHGVGYLNQDLYNRLTPKPYQLCFRTLQQRLNAKHILAPQVKWQGEES